MKFSRYRPFNRDHLKTEIELGAVHLQHITNQNDPFEARFAYDLHVTLDRLIQFFRSLRNTVLSGSSKNDKQWLYGIDKEQLQSLKDRLATMNNRAITKLASDIYHRGVYEDPSTINAITAGHRAGCMSEPSWHASH